MCCVPAPRVLVWAVCWLLKRLLGVSLAVSGWRLGGVDTVTLQSSSTEVVSCYILISPSYFFLFTYNYRKCSVVYMIIQITLLFAW